MPLKPVTGLETALRVEATRLGFDLVGITDVRPSEHAAFYRAWLAAGYHGSMAYLAREDAIERRSDATSAFPELRSAIVVGLNYYADTDPSASAVADADAERGIIARYARGRDYHKVLKQKLLALLSWLEGELGRELPHARASVDTAPVFERELAQRAGLGWFGRNSMLINPRRGSYFFIGTLLLDIELSPDAPFDEDHCGTCNACVSACPTGALLGRDGSGAPVVDATRCISYQTIENRGPIPRELRPLIGNRVFGCDICQEVCPWNGSKFVSLTRERDFDGRERDRERKRQRLREQRDELPATTVPSLISLMRMTYEDWDECTRGSAMRRSGYVGFRRNVAVALGNWGSAEAVPVLSLALSDPTPSVRGHAVWALGEIGAPESFSALEALASSEADPFVLAELEEALGRLRPNVK